MSDDWSFALRKGSVGDESDSGSESEVEAPDDSHQASEGEDDVPLPKSNPWSIAKFNAACRPAQVPIGAGEDMHTPICSTDLSRKESSEMARKRPSGKKPQLRIQAAFHTQSQNSRIRKKIDQRNTKSNNSSNTRPNEMLPELFSSPAPALLATDRIGRRPLASQSFSLPSRSKSSPRPKRNPLNQASRISPSASNLNDAIPESFSKTPAAYSTSFMAGHYSQSSPATFVPAPARFVSAFRSSTLHTASAPPFEVSPDVDPVPLSDKKPRFPPLLSDVEVVQLNRSHRPHSARIPQDIDQRRIEGYSLGLNRLVDHTSSNLDLRSVESDLILHDPSRSVPTYEPRIVDPNNYPEADVVLGVDEYRIPPGSDHSYYRDLLPSASNKDEYSELPQRTLLPEPETNRAHIGGDVEPQSFQVTRSSSESPPSSPTPITSKVRRRLTAASGAYRTEKRVRRVNLDEDEDIWSTLPSRRLRRSTDTSQSKSGITTTTRFTLPAIRAPKVKTNSHPNTKTAYRPPPKSKIIGDAPDIGSWKVTKITAKDLNMRALPSDPSNPFPKRHHERNYSDFDDTSDETLVDDNGESSKLHISMNKLSRTYPRNRIAIRQRVSGREEGTF